MKRSSLLIVSGLFIITGFTSCLKCQICTKDSEPELRVCRNDYNTNTQYGAALDAYEIVGYDCK
jgi:hypothetical protein